MKRYNYFTQKGVALITALLVVALATVTAVTMTATQQRDIYRTSNVLNHEQAYLYLLGSEDWAQQILLQDARQTNQDHLNETWATQLPPLPVLGGMVQGQLYDLHRCFNLNNLIKTTNKINPIYQQYFERLLTLLDISPNVSQKIIDWIDKDENITMPYGAEDGAYLSAQPKAYRAANQLLTHHSELRLVKGIDQSTFAKLTPYICTLPTTTRININSAPFELLLSLHKDLKPDAVQKLIEWREQSEKGFDSVNTFLQHEALADIAIEPKLLTVKSEYFSFIGKAEIGQGVAHLHSIFQRKQDEIRTIFRSHNLN